MPRYVSALRRHSLASSRSDVTGGRVVADWPGLSTSALYEGRDLKPTTDLESFMAGAMAQHYALEPSEVMNRLFSESCERALAKPLIG